MAEYERKKDLLLELPLPVVEGTDLASLEPARDAVEVERVLNTRHIHAEYMLHNGIRELAYMS